MKIALFGGKFDPPHNGHVTVAKTVLRLRPDIDQLWFVPANTHPWRTIAGSAKDRLAMVKLLEDDRMKVYDGDLKKGGETYTIDTVKELQGTTDHTFVYVCGTDQIKDFSKWKDYRGLLQRVPFLLFPRVGYDENVGIIIDEGTKYCAPTDTFFVLENRDIVPSSFSSSDIRAAVKAGQSIDQLVPEKIKEYILQHNLYV